MSSSNKLVMASGGGGSGGPVSAFVFLSTSPSSNSTYLQYQKSRYEEMAEDLELDITVDFYQSDATSQWTAASNNDHSFSISASTFLENYDCGFFATNYSANTYAKLFITQMISDGKGFGYGMYASAGHQLTSLISNSSCRITTNAGFSNASVLIDVSSVDEEFCNGIGSFFTATSGPYPVGGLSAATGATGFGSSSAGGSAIVAKNATGSTPRVIATHHQHAQLSNFDSHLPISSGALSTLGSSAQNSIKHHVQALNWLGGNGDDI